MKMWKSARTRRIFINLKWKNFPQILYWADSWRLVSLFAYIMKFKLVKFDFCCLSYKSQRNILYKSCRPLYELLTNVKSADLIHVYDEIPYIWQTYYKDASLPTQPLVYLSTLYKRNQCSTPSYFLSKPKISFLVSPSIFQNTFGQRGRLRIKTFNYNKMVNLVNDVQVGKSKSQPYIEGCLKDSGGGRCLNLKKLII